MAFAGSPEEVKVFDLLLSLIARFLRPAPPGVIHSAGTTTPPAAVGAHNAAAGGGGPSGKGTRRQGDDALALSVSPCPPVSAPAQAPSKMTGVSLYLIGLKNYDTLMLVTIRGRTACVPLTWYGIGAVERN